MKNKFLPLVLLLFGSAAFSQVGIGTLNPSESSMLEVSSTNKGILIPRVALLSRADTTTIQPGNIDSLLVFNTTDNDVIKPGFYYWYVDRWEKFSNSSDLEQLQNDNEGSISIVVVGTDLVLTDVHGNQTSIPLSDLNINTTLVNNGDGTYTYTSENNTVTIIDVPADVINNIEEILNNSVTIDGNTYNTLEEYITYLTNTTGSNTKIVYDQAGNVEFQIWDSTTNSWITVDNTKFETIVKANETITTLVNNNNGSYTYTSEDGTVTNINVTEDVANYFETILNEGPITIGGVTYNTFEEYLTHVVKSNETITTLVNNNDGTYTYVSENGTVTLIDVKGDVANYFTDILNEGPIIVDGNTYPTFEDYLTTIIQSKQTITTLVNNNNGSYTYTSEDGTTTTIDVPADVANYFETILNEGPITIGGNTYPTFEDYLTYVVKSNETITTLVNNNDGTYTYVSENGTVTLIDVKGDVANYFTDILNEGPIIVDGNTYPTFEDYLTTIIQSKQTITTLVNNNNGSYTYTSEDGTTTTIDVPADVANYFETILNEGPITIGGNTYPTFEDYLTYVVKSNETITTLVNNNDGTYTYVSENGTVTLIDVKGDVANYFSDILNEGPIIVDGNTYPTFEDYLTTIIQSKQTITTLENNNDGTYTYTSEDGTTTTIDVPADVINNIEEIFNNPVTIDGNTYNTLEEYITYLTNTTGSNTKIVYDQAGNVEFQIWDPTTNSWITVDNTKFETIVKASETVTTLTKTSVNGAEVPGSYTYENEAGTKFVFNVVEDVTNNFEEIFNNAQNLEELVQYLTNTTVGGNVKYDGNTFTYIDQAGVTQSINFESLVKANETITTLTYDSVNKSFTYINENGPSDAVTVDLSQMGIEPWNVQGSNDKATSNTDDIYQMGKVAVGASAWPTAPSSTDVKLFVEGDLEVTGKFWSATSVYADYVFEKYFTGESDLNSNYKFNELKDVKEFIKKNHHLPGVTPIGDLKKSGNGYMIDFSKLSNEQLEKIEELYIHTIEQQELIESQTNEINSLKERLLRIEKIIE